MTLRASKKIPFVSRDSPTRKEVQHPSEPLGLEQLRHIFTHQRNYSHVLLLSFRFFFSRNYPFSKIFFYHFNSKLWIIRMNHAMEKEFFFATIRVFTVMNERVRVILARSLGICERTTLICFRSCSSQIFFSEFSFKGLVSWRASCFRKKWTPLGDLKRDNAAIFTSSGISHSTHRRCYDTDAAINSNHVSERANAPRLFLRDQRETNDVVRCCLLVRSCALQESWLLDYKARELYWSECSARSSRNPRGARAIATATKGRGSAAWQFPPFWRLTTAQDGERQLSQVRNSSRRYGSWSTATTTRRVREVASTVPRSRERPARAEIQMEHLCRVILDANWSFFFFRNSSNERAGRNCRKKRERNANTTVVVACVQRVQMFITKWRLTYNKMAYVWQNGVWGAYALLRKLKQWETSFLSVGFTPYDF